MSGSACDCIFVLPAAPLVRRNASILSVFHEAVAVQDFQGAIEVRLNKSNDLHEVYLFYPGKLLKHDINDALPVEFGEAIFEW